MIRKFENLDLDAVMQIWLQANLDAHAFIPASFWEAHFETVRDMLPQAELYVHENEIIIPSLIQRNGIIKKYALAV